MLLITVQFLNEDLGVDFELYVVMSDKFALTGKLTIRSIVPLHTNLDIYSIRTHDS